MCLRVLLSGISVLHIKACANWYGSLKLKHKPVRFSKHSNLLVCSCWLVHAQFTAGRYHIHAEF
jgi:hypothetical protein